MKKLIKILNTIKYINLFQKINKNFYYKVSIFAYVILSVLKNNILYLSNIALIFSPSFHIIYNCFAHYMTLHL